MIEVFVGGSCAVTYIFSAHRLLAKIFVGYNGVRECRGQSTLHSVCQSGQVTVTVPGDNAGQPIKAKGNC